MDRGGNRRCSHRYPLSWRLERRPRTSRRPPVRGVVQHSRDDLLRRSRTGVRSGDVPTLSRVRRCVLPRPSGRRGSAATDRAPHLVGTELLRTTTRPEHHQLPRPCRDSGPLVGPDRPAGAAGGGPHRPVDDSVVTWVALRNNRRF